MILLFWFYIHAAQATVSCPPTEQFKFSVSEQKLNLDGNGKADVVAVFTAGECSRRAVIFDAPEDLKSATNPPWLGETYFSDPEVQSSHISLESRPVAGRDILLVEEEVGTFKSSIYFVGEKGQLKKVLSFGHPQTDGQLTDLYNKKTKKLTVRIFDSGGALEVNGSVVDLDQRAIKARCRVRELYIQLKYEWSVGIEAFKETDQACVMGPAID